MTENKINTQKTTRQQLEEKQIVPLDSLLDSDIPETKWIIPNLIPEGGITLLAGRPKDFKSFVSMFMSCCIVSGKEFLSLKTNKGKVLYIDEENGYPELKRRFGKFNVAMNLSKEELHDVGLMVLKGIKINNLDINKRLLETIIEHYKPSLVIIDSFVRVLEGDENKAQDVRKLFDFLRDSMSKYGTSWLVLHHVKKNGNQTITVEDIRGSSDLVAQASSILILRKFADNYYSLLHAETRCSKETVGEIQFKVIDKEIGNKEGMWLETIGAIPVQITCKANVAAAKDITQWLKNTNIKEFKTKDATNALKVKHATNAINDGLKHLCNEGIIKKLRQGNWILMKESF